MRQILGLLGRKGAGKDTAAKVLLEQGWGRLAFADPLYREAAAAFNVTVEFLGNRETKETPLPELALYKCRDQVFVAVMLSHAVLRCGVSSDEAAISEFLLQARSPREVLQIWGTEYKRQVVRDDYWIEQVRQAIINEPERSFVITDVRFPNEARMVHEEFNGVLARVVRPSLANLDDGGLQHASEAAMAGYPVDVELLNEDGAQGLSALKAAVLGCELLKLKSHSEVN